MEQRYEDQSRSTRVEITEEATSAILSLCEQAAGLETGGILVGFYSADGVVAHINEALGPPKGSQSTRTKFMRSPSGLKGILQRRWSSQQYYLGEWHFHPQGRGCPSRQDQRQLAEIGSDGAYSCPKPILIVVGGCSNDRKIGVWVLADGQLARLRRVPQSTQVNDTLRAGSGLQSD